VAIDESGEHLPCSPHRFAHGHFTQYPHQVFAGKLFHDDEPGLFVEADRARQPHRVDRGNTTYR
jgi:hypothetical protein